MAIDPRISLAAQPINLGQMFNQQKRNLLLSRQIDQQAIDAPLQTSLLQGQVDQQAFAAPFQNQMLEIQASQAQAGQNLANENRIIKSISDFSPTLKPLLESAIASGDTSAAVAAIDNRISQLQRLNLPVEESVEARSKLVQGNVQGVINDLNSIDQAAVSRGLVGSRTSVGQREFENLVGIAKNDPEGKTVEGRAAGVKLGTIAKASTSAAERIAGDTDLTQSVASSAATIEGAKESAKEGAKLKQQLNHKPAIARAVKLAEKEAIEKGEVLTALNRSKAALPGLLTAVDELKDLSSIATSTIGGKIFDAAVKQTGFGSTKGATARAKFIAIVNNQVLPLLKETFGAAFTAQEGEALKATMGDPDASPEEKMVQLEAFITQKQRDIQTRERQLEPQEQEPEQQQAAGFSSSALGRQVSEQDIADTLQANPGITREQLLKQLGIQ